MSSQAHALSDDQVGQELKKMTAFIKQEAMEKAREIEIKADEEFAIEKSKLVRQETAAIDAAYAKKFKAATMSQQIARSTVANKTRLRILAARQALLDDLFAGARARLPEVARDAARYEAVLRALLLEGLYALDEPAVAVRARPADYAVLGRAVAGAARDYEETMGKPVTAEIDEKNPLPEASSGGITIVGGGGKIDINNTFEERLKLLEDKALPAVRNTLFGPNENRKFFD